MGIKHALQFIQRLETDIAGYDFAVLKYQNRWNAGDSIFDGQFHVIVHIDFGND